jgi:predicted naringenin-chalcone synthase
MLVPDIGENRFFNRSVNMKVILRGLGTAHPSRYATQEEVYDFFTSCFSLKASERELYRRILLDGRIKGRHLGIELASDILEPDPDKRLARFLRFGRAIAAIAARRAMAEADVEAGEIAGLVVNTCTGYLCPGLSSYIAEDLGLRRSVHFQDLVGMGCGGAIPNLEAAAGMLAGGLRGPVLCVAVEICTATIFPSHEPELVVSNSIFSDGAAAAVLDSAVNDSNPAIASLLDFESVLIPGYRDELRYLTQGGRLRNRLSRRVPSIAARAAREVTSLVLSRHEVDRSDVRWWAIHPGGTVVLEQICRQLELSEKELAYSGRIFELYGNMSSPSVLFVLREILDSGSPRAGQKGMMIAFGAGFSAFAVLMEFACNTSKLLPHQSGSEAVQEVVHDR